MITPTNIHMATDLFEGRKINILSKSGAVDMTGVCKFIKSISFRDEDDPTVVIDLNVTSSITFNVETPISLINVVED